MSLQLEFTKAKNVFASAVENLSLIGEKIDHILLRATHLTPEQKVETLRGLTLEMNLLRQKIVNVGDAKTIRVSVLCNQVYPGYKFKYKGIDYIRKARPDDSRYSVRIVDEQVVVIPDGELVEVTL